LAKEVRQLGHSATVIALADKFIEQAVSINQGTDEELGQTLRLPAKWQWPQRIERASDFLGRFGPDWVSLQFVCYGYHPKGIIHGLGDKVAPLIKGRKLHMMFHETWLCKQLGFGWRQRAVGALQRHFIQQFVTAVRPDIIHTSNPTYVALLNRAGIHATELPLFGNIPVLNASELKWIESELRTALGNGYHRETAWLFGLFGALHSQWPPEPLLTYLHRASNEAGRKPVLLSIGRTGAAGFELWNRMAQNYSGSFGFVHFGEQPVARISEYLSYMDYGIATTPRSIIGKSGTVIAMLEHGLPVIVNRDDAETIGTSLENSDPLLIPCDAELENQLRGGLKKGRRGSRCPQVARSFVSALNQAAESQIRPK
jgi:hypothetical protein